jgi:hypothetical protein
MEAILHTSPDAAQVGRHAALVKLVVGHSAAPQCRAAPLTAPQPSPTERTASNWSSRPPLRLGGPSGPQLNAAVIAGLQSQALEARRGSQKTFDDADPLEGLVMSIERSLMSRIIGLFGETTANRSDVALGFRPHRDELILSVLLLLS